MAHYLVTICEKEFDVRIEYEGNKYQAVVNGDSQEVSCDNLGGSRMLMQVDGRSSEIDVRSNGYDGQRTILIEGMEIDAEIEDFRMAQAKKVAGISSIISSVKAVKAPMPGLVLEIRIAEGDTVKTNQPLVLIEAMKMENVIKACAPGIVKKVCVTSGQSVEKNDLLVEFE